jgi:hypothetical protein
MQGALARACGCQSWTWVMGELVGIVKLTSFQLSAGWQDPLMSPCEESLCPRCWFFCAWVEAQPRKGVWCCDVSFHGTSEGPLSFVSTLPFLQSAVLPPPWHWLCQTLVMPSPPFTHPSLACARPLFEYRGHMWTGLSPALHSGTLFWRWNGQWRSEQFTRQGGCYEGKI